MAEKETDQSKPKYQKVEKKFCLTCKKEKYPHYFKNNSKTCTRCETLKNAKALESIFEEEKRLEKEARHLASSNTKSEEWKLANGYSWQWIEVQVTKTATRKMRVLTKK